MVGVAWCHTQTRPQPQSQGDVNNSNVPLSLTTVSQNILLSGLISLGFCRESARYMTWIIIAV